MWRRFKFMFFQPLCKEESLQWFSARFSSETPFTKKKGKLAPLQERKMVDKYRIWVKGGHGGNGCTSYIRSRRSRHGIPDGGCGGKGGDVILESSSAIWDLSNLQHHLNAKKGSHGLAKNKVGSRGADKVVQVPVGTVVHLVSGIIPSTVQGTPVQERFPWEVPTTCLQNNENSEGEFQRNSKMIWEENISANREDYALSSNRKSKISSGEVSSDSNVGQITNSDVSGDELNSCKNVDQTLRSNQFDNNERTDSEELYSDSETSKYKSAALDSEFDDEEETEAEEIQYSVTEFVEPGQRLIVACGGDGGRGNLAVGRASRIDKAKSIESYDSSEKMEDADMDFDRVKEKARLRCEHEDGQPGSEAVLVLELKSIADIGLVGFPNAGKSTLLGAISRAKPSVGHYAFTTLRPNIGKLEYEDFFCITVADIPGLIRGAHENRGLGHAFLRHIERTKALAYVVDLSAGLGNRKGIQPWHHLRDLVFELEQHQSGLSNRSSLIVANKIDENGAEEMFFELKRRIPSVPIFPVCAVLEDGIPELKVGLRELIDGPKSWKLELNQICVD